jgi:hypothetical protein
LRDAIRALERMREARCADDDGIADAIERSDRSTSL